MFTIKSINSRNLIFTFIAVLMLGTTVGFSQNCSADLSVKKNRSTKSVDQDGTTFFLNLKNTSSSNQTYTISSINLKEPCNNKSTNSGLSNVNLNVAINYDKSLASNKIKIAPNQTYSFEVFVSVPKGTTLKRWSCVKIQVNSIKCNSVSDMIILKVFVSDPSEE